MWEALGEWVTEAKPDLGPGTKQRFEMASKLQPDEVADSLRQTHDCAANARDIDEALMTSSPPTCSSQSDMRLMLMCTQKGQSCGTCSLPCEGAQGKADA